MIKDSTSENGKWRYDGVKVVSGQHLDVNTPQTEGMNRARFIPSVWGVFTSRC